AVRGQIQDIIPQVYSTTLATGIDRQVTTVLGDHDGYESNHRVGSWGEPDSMSQVGTVSRDADVPGNLYGEIWEATWTREHEWRHYYVVEYDCEKTRKVSCTDSEGNPDTCTETYMDTCYRTEHNEMTTIDTREDRVTVTLNAKENSKTSIQLNYAGTTISTCNDIDDAYTSKDVDHDSTHTDPGLEEAYDSYKSETFDPNVESNVKNRGLDGDNYDPETFDVTAPGWLEAEVRYAVDEITQQIRSDVHLSPDINYMEYPNPADAMEATAIDLTNKIEANQSRYVDKARYYSGGKYSSCSAKTISQVREWYVDEVLHQVNEQYGGAAGNINEQIDDKFGESASDVREANKNGASLLKSALCFPIGLTMRAEHVMDDGTKYGVDDLAYWDENVTLMVDMEPDYLFEDSDGGKQLINLGVQNVCFFGPTGVPVLPPPNYVVHFNSWMINVEGQIDGFTLVDADNEVHPNPMFGHEAQVYRRVDLPVRDPSNNFIDIGYTTPIKFKFSTGTFIIVPPGKTIGDIDGYDLESIIPFSETSLEYGNI
ncbi:MAG: hypothetical protein GQ469_07245, partial [Methanosarcinales archaeon]|nr:hypothetical protein [Methanosarcinales archaeon]